MYRSRSPAVKRADDTRRRGAEEQTDRARSKSPGARHSRSHRRHRHRNRADDKHAHSTPQALAELPHSARQLSKNDFLVFKPLFAYYLDLQKQKYIQDLDEREVKGRWKSFIGRWNRGELAEGWYDPDMFARITADTQEAPQPDDRGRAIRPVETKKPAQSSGHGGEDETDDDYGPTLASSTSGNRAGAAAPTLQDLSLRDELNAESNSAAREASLSDLRESRRLDRKDQKEKLDELVPRAVAGTRERKLEKRQLVNEKMREFRDKSPGMEGADEKDLIGGGDDDLAAYKRAKENEQRRKSEREIRREEIQRAKMEEMEGKRKAWKVREEGTVSMLRELAKQRFG